MKCPHCGRRINPAAVLGAVGGRAAGARKARDPAKMRAAALKRWADHKISLVKKDDHC
jgi:hypothetical protein